VCRFRSEKRRGSPKESLRVGFSLETIEREHIFRVLANAPTQEEAARILGVDISTLWRKRKRYHCH
jgi:NtrC-family two-component system response regulator AlgB